MNNDLVRNMSIICNHAEKTQKNYENALRKYCEYFNQSIPELLSEAEEDENNNVKWKNCRLKAKLLEYRHHLLENSALNTAKKDIKCIQFFYKFYDIEVQQLPRISQKSIRKPQPIYFKDLPDKEIIREAFKISSPIMKAMILFSCSSGCARAECLSLTVQDYINSLYEYLPRNKTDIFEIIDYLDECDNVVPTFNILRNKTNKYYITYCSPEAVKAINAYLLTRKDPFTNDSRLFKISPQHMGRLYQKINNSLEIGNVGEYSRFRSHMLRKFHASALYNDGMTLDKVNDLQGKSKNSTDSVYFMTNPEDLKYEYIKHLPAVTINVDVENVSGKSSEITPMENETNELKTELDSIKAEVSDLTSIKAEIADLKSFKEEILSLKHSISDGE